MHLSSLRSHKEGPPLSARAQDLARELKGAVRGEVRFDVQARALFAADASNYRHVPIGVVFPRDAQDVLSTLRACRTFGVPVVSRGAGTSLAGQTANVAVVMDFSRHMRGVLQVDPRQRFARVLPGTVLDELRASTGVHHLTFGPDPATHDRCTLGGMIGNSACGVHALQAEFYGPGPRTEDNVEELEIVTYDSERFRVGPTSESDLARIIAAGGRRGKIYRRLAALRDRHADRIRHEFPHIPRRVSGYNLPELLPERGFNVARALVGSEGTCVTVLEAKLSLIDALAERVLLVAGFRSIADAGDVVEIVRQHRPVGCEGIDQRLVQYLRRKHEHLADIEALPEGHAWLLIEMGAETRDEARASAEDCRRALRSTALGTEIITDPRIQHELWTVRESALAATAFVPGQRDAWPGWEDSAVPVERVGAYLRELRQLLDRHGYDCALYGHLGQGCVHTRIDFELRTAEGVERYASFTREAAELVLRHGGSLSGEHGDGQARSDLLQQMYGPELIDAFREFKAIWDPEGRMNPGRIVDPLPRTENLRVGPDYHPAQPESYFAYAEDGGDFAHATMRCVGVGECRRDGGGTMCPSWMVTHDEAHTTRGRAHLLFEMLRGDVIKNGFASDAVKESLDLCLACKGCKGECPVQVDMATYKAEFLSRYYRHHRRPRVAFAFGYIDVWLRIGSMLPGLANFATHAPGLSQLSKWIAGVGPTRDAPRFAPQSFRAWFALQRGERRIERGPRVLLWPDTFNDAFHPQTLVAALEVLEHAGFSVDLPRVRLCCGRPLYDFGMLDRARKYWKKILDALEDDIAAGTPLVGIEPSCVSAFRDELPSLMHEDPRAERLSKLTRSLSEFLEAEEVSFPLPPVAAKALLHAHCHQKALRGLGADLKLLDRMGLTVEAPATGCCGMAGAFGFERDKVEISTQIGERVLLPAVRNAELETVIVADGFSCREQIRQTTERSALHTAEVIKLALHQHELSERDELPEKRHERLAPAPTRSRASAATALVALVLAIGMLAWWVAERVIH